jgi:hypothetical protein
MLLIRGENPRRRQAENPLMQLSNFAEPALSDRWERAMKSAYAALTRLDDNPPENITVLRGLEANCAASYFRSWVGMPIKWRGTSRRPIPDSWHKIGPRSSPYHLAGNRNPAHPVNAILNCRARKRNSDQSHFRWL